MSYTIRNAVCWRERPCFTVRERPDAPGINYEPIKGAKGKDFYSVPISQAYRAVVFHPSNSQVYVLSWVDHHDEAYR